MSHNPASDDSGDVIEVLRKELHDAHVAIGVAVLVMTPAQAREWKTRYLAITTEADDA